MRGLYDSTIGVFATLIGLGFNAFGMYFLVEVFWFPDEPSAKVIGLKVAPAIIALLYVPTEMFVQRTWAHWRSGVRVLGTVDVVVARAFLALWIATVVVAIYHSPDGARDVINAWQKAKTLDAIVTPILNSIVPFAILYAFGVCVLDDVVWNGKHAEPGAGSTMASHGDGASPVALAILNKLEELVDKDEDGFSVFKNRTGLTLTQTHTRK